MRRLIPRRSEFVILTILALSFAALASATLKEDIALSFGAVPLFVVSCLLGMKRNGQLSRRD